MSNLFFGTLLGCLLLLLVFIIPKGYKYYVALTIVAATAFVTVFWAVQVLTCIEDDVLTKQITLSNVIYQTLKIDKLSSFFIIAINITCLTGFLYARGYLKPYLNFKTNIQLSIHYFSFVLLHISMLLVVMLTDALSFLIAWEIMAIASFLLVIFDAEQRNILKTGISYLIQMHVGMFFLLIAFFIVEKDSGYSGFDGLSLFFSTHNNIPVFLLFLAGFGIKAGFFPLHTWLPDAHPAAPSHVSGVMSGVMIKMGIYGIMRVVFNLHNNLIIIGFIVLSISLLTGLFGVMMAIIQHDLKKLLAYHSIENIGIIGIGLGVGIFGMAYNSNILILMGFGGSLLHVFNHSLFKSLLFYGAGSVYQATHTRNIEKMGGLMKRMPVTAIFFLTGSLAICGLPPFNGFVSEFLIYSGLFNGLSFTDLNITAIIVITISLLALIGGLALYCFTKAFGVTFLGEPRSQELEKVQERSFDMILPQLIPVFLIILIGLSPSLFVKPIEDIIISHFRIGFPVLKDIGINNIIMMKVGFAGGFLIVFSSVIFLWKYFHLKKVSIKSGPTWGCGYSSVSPSMQYTSTSFAYNYNHLSKVVTATRKQYNEPEENELFPSVRSFSMHAEDPVKINLIDKPVELAWTLLKKIAVMQTGKIHHYILYAFIFILAALILTFFGII